MTAWKRIWGAPSFEVTPRTIDNYISKYEKELRHNGYEVIHGKRLNKFRLAVRNQYVNETDFVNIKVPKLGVFDFRAFLNIAMLIAESERARLVRQAILDIVIDTINQRTGGGNKYINQRDEDFIFAYFQGENYRKDFTSALSRFVGMGNFKYPLYTDKIYVSIFREKPGNTGKPKIEKSIVVGIISTLWTSILKWRQTSTRYWQNVIAKREMEAV